MCARVSNGLTPDDVFPVILKRLGNRQAITTQKRLPSHDDPALGRYEPSKEATETLMSHTPHELAEDFPQFGAKISELQKSDTHFARLAEDYHAINRAVHRAETDLEPTTDEHLSKMRKTRMGLKDQIHSYLKPE